MRGEAVLCDGKAGTRVRSRVGQYDRTRLGARSPHAGGWPLKTLASLGRLQVHTARCDDPGKAEAAILAAFMCAVSEHVGPNLRDPSMPLPFANPEDRTARAKPHCRRGASGPR